jgi:hypothetical protein
LAVREIVIGGARRRAYIRCAVISTGDKGGGAEAALLMMNSQLRARAADEALQSLAIGVFLKITAGGLALFLILRVFAPWAISRHDTLLLWLGVGAMLVCPVILIRLAFTLRRDWLRARALTARPS